MAKSPLKIDPHCDLPHVSKGAALRVVPHLLPQDINVTAQTAEVLDVAESETKLSPRSHLGPFRINLRSSFTANCSGISRTEAMIAKDGPSEGEELDWDKITRGIQEVADRITVEAAAEAEKDAVEGVVKVEARLLAQSILRLLFEVVAKTEVARLEQESWAANQAAKVEAGRLAQLVVRFALEVAAKAESAKLDQERLVAETLAKAEASRLAAEHTAKEAADRLAAEKAEAGRLAAAKEAADRLVAEVAAEAERRRLLEETALAEVHRFSVQITGKLRTKLAEDHVAKEQARGREGVEGLRTKLAEGHAAKEKAQRRQSGEGFRQTATAKYETAERERLCGDHAWYSACDGVRGLCDADEETVEESPTLEKYSKHDDQFASDQVSEEYFEDVAAQSRLEEAQTRSSGF